MKYEFGQLRSWTRTDRQAGAAAGLAGGAAYAAAMAVDLRLFRYNADDYVLLGGVLGLQPGAASRVGKGIHIMNSAVVGMLFERLAYRRMPFSPAANGALFATLENALLYPVLVVEHKHPLIRRGELPSYRNGTAFTQSVIRHVAYGAVCGWALDRLMKRSAKGA